MPYLFPIPQVAALEDALDIAMDYLEHTGQAFPLPNTERFCGEVIYEEWSTGRRHPIWLATGRSAPSNTRGKRTGSASCTSP